MQARDLEFPANYMSKPKNQLFCRLDGFTPSARREQIRTTLARLGLTSTEGVPLFEETTQKAATFSGAPIGILGLVVEDELWFKSAVGLSTNGLTDPLAARRKIPLGESFSTYVIDSQQPLIIDNTLSSPVFANSVLAQHYGIKAYLGVPLICSGTCIGTLEVMDWADKKFDKRDLDHLTLLARWCLGEFERAQNDNAQFSSSFSGYAQSPWSNSGNSSTSAIAPAHFSSDSQSLELESDRSENQSDADATHPFQIKLLSQLTQELRTPLTSVIGMASVLYREVYGPLTIKQREYLEIIHNSGQNLITLVDEIVSLGVLNDEGSEINLAAVDIEMLCQQVINSLSDLAKQRQQKLHLSVEPGNRVWFLDKEKIRQAVYYLIVSVLEMSEPGGEVRIHVSKREYALNIAVGITHPWLGEDFGATKLHSQTVEKALSLSNDNLGDRPFEMGMSKVALANRQILTCSALMMATEEENALDRNNNKIPRDLLGLLFCCHLSELHEGKVIVQGSVRSGYRYLLQFPHARLDEQNTGFA